MFKAARGRVTFAYFLTIFLLTAFLASAMAGEAEDYTFKKELIEVGVFCESESPYKEIKEALAVGGVDLAQQVAVITASTGICKVIRSGVAFLPVRVATIYPADEYDPKSFVVEGLVTSVARGKVTAYIWMNKKDFKKILLGEDV